MKSAGYAVVTVTGHTSQYPDPIQFEPGDLLELGKRDTEYPGWIWVRVPSGKEGWAPECLLEARFDGRSVATESYTAKELNTSIGEPLTVLQELNEWLWVENSQGECGWIPMRTVEATSGKSDDPTARRNPRRPQPTPN